MRTPLVSLAERGAAGLFGLLARGFSGRSLHPSGVAFAATLEVPGPTAPELELFDETSRRPAFVRFSRGFGLPDPLPEILSLAIKIPDAYGPGRDQDFLLTASGGAPVLRHTFAAGRSHLHRSYSSVIPFTAAGRRVVFGAFPSPRASRRPGDLDELRAVAARGELTLDLRMAGLLGPWQDLARVRVGRPLQNAQERTLGFNSDTTGGGIEAAGAINRVRGAAYAASLRARLR